MYPTKVFILLVSSLSGVNFGMVNFRGITIYREEIIKEYWDYLENLEVS